jgi:hypothetical protein
MVGSLDWIPVKFIKEWPLELHNPFWKAYRVFYGIEFREITHDSMCPFYPVDDIQKKCC